MEFLIETARAVPGTSLGPDNAPVAGAIGPALSHEISDIQEIRHNSAKKRQLLESCLFLVE